MDTPDLEKMTPEQIAECQKQNCIFCKIIKGEIPSRKVYEDDLLVSILDINPASKGHLLVMPKKHYPFLPMVPEDEARHMYSITLELTRALKEAMVVDKVDLFLANGAVAGQQSPHFIYHLIPAEKSLFSLPQQDISPGEAQKLANNLAGMLKPFEQERKISFLVELLGSNPELKASIIKDPQGFAKESARHPELANLVSQIDVNVLAERLKRAK